MSEYVHPEVLVDSKWVADHLHDSNVRLIEADEDVLLYEVGHIPGAVKLDWHVDVQDKVARDFLSQKEFEQLMSRWGISNDTTIVLYGDKNNWYACYSFWLFSMYGHTNQKIMNGGRSKWEAEQRPLTEAKARRLPSRMPSFRTAKGSSTSCVSCIKAPRAKNGLCVAHFRDGDC